MNIEELDEIERTLKTSKPYCELGTYDYFNCESIEKLLKENQQLKDRITKAIEYIGSKEMYNDDFDTETNKLLDLLKGNKEE